MDYWEWFVSVGICSWSAVATNQPSQQSWPHQRFTVLLQRTRHLRSQSASGTSLVTVKSDTGVQHFVAQTKCCVLLCLEICVASFRTSERCSCWSLVSIRCSFFHFHKSCPSRESGPLLVAYPEITIIANTDQIWCLMNASISWAHFTNTVLFCLLYKTKLCYSRHVSCAIFQQLIVYLIESQNILWILEWKCWHL